MSSDAFRTGAPEELRNMATALLSAAQGDGARLRGLVGSACASLNLAADRAVELEGALNDSVAQVLRMKNGGRQDPADCRHEWGPPGDVDAGAVCRDCGIKCPLSWEAARLLRKRDEVLADWLHRCADYDDDTILAVRRVAADRIAELEKGVNTASELERDTRRELNKLRGQRAMDAQAAGGGKLPEKSDANQVTGPNPKDFAVFHKLRQAIEAHALPGAHLANECGISIDDWTWHEVAKQMHGIAERESMRAGDGPIHYMDLERKLYAATERIETLEREAAMFDCGADGSRPGGGLCGAFTPCVRCRDAVGYERLLGEAKDKAEKAIGELKAEVAEVNAARVAGAQSQADTFEERDRLRARVAAADKLYGVTVEHNMHVVDVACHDHAALDPACPITEARRAYHRTGQA